MITTTRSPVERARQAVASSVMSTAAAEDLAAAHEQRVAARVDERR